MTEEDLATFIRLGRAYYGESDETLTLTAQGIERRYGELMLKRMIGWLHDPYARESPIATFARWRDFLTNPETKERNAL